MPSLEDLNREMNRHFRSDWVAEPGGAKYRVGGRPLLTGAHDNGLALEYGNSRYWCTTNEHLRQAVRAIRHVVDADLRTDLDSAFRDALRQAGSRLFTIRGQLFQSDSNLESEMVLLSCYRQDLHFTLMYTGHDGAQVWWGGDIRSDGVTLETKFGRNSIPDTIEALEGFLVGVGALPRDRPSPPPTGPTRWEALDDAH